MKCFGTCSVPSPTRFIRGPCFDLRMVYATRARTAMPLTVTTTCQAEPINPCYWKSGTDEKIVTAAWHNYAVISPSGAQLRNNTPNPSSRCASDGRDPTSRTPRRRAVSAVAFPENGSTHAGATATVDPHWMNLELAWRREDGRWMRVGG